MSAAVSAAKLPSGLRVAIVPFPALGDITIYLRLSQSFVAAGAQVTYLSDHLASAAHFFPWLTVQRLEGSELSALVDSFDLVVWDAGVAPGASSGEDAGDVLADLVSSHSNLAVVTSKSLPNALRTCTTRIRIGSECFGSACAAFCHDSKAGLTMVDWVDRYAAETFGLVSQDAAPMVECGPRPVQERRRVVVFPTTPNPRKNYWPCGFRAIAQRLKASGWAVSFVSTPAERSRLEAEYPGFPSETFPDLGALIAYLCGACMVISNDSGGGHLASMMGLPTVTITRKPIDFVWRPGFNQANIVLSPMFTFKGVGGHVWRPFIPFWRVMSYVDAAFQRHVRVTEDRVSENG